MLASCMLRLLHLGRGSHLRPMRVPLAFAWLAPVAMGLVRGRRCNRSYARANTSRLFCAGASDQPTTPTTVKSNMFKKLKQ